MAALRAKRWVYLDRQRMDDVSGLMICDERRAVEYGPEGHWPDSL